MRRTAVRWVPVPIAVAVAVALAVPWGAASAASSSAVGPVSVAAPGPTSATAGPFEVAPGFFATSGVADLGPAPSNTSLTVDVGLASQDPAGLDAFVNATQIPGTAAYRSYLSPSAAAARFGAEPSSVAEAEAYFAQFGLSAVAHPDGLIVSVSGPAPEIGRAFGTTIDRYRAADGTTFLDHPTTATLPGNEPWTGAVGLDTAVSFAPELSGVGAPAYDVGPSAGCGPVGGVSACEVANAYDLAGLFANGTDGAGESIAVVDPYVSAENQSQLAADFATFSIDEGLPTTSPGFAYPVPSPGDLNVTALNPDWQYEDPLDLEWAHAAAPGANVTMVFSPNAGTGLYFAIDWIVAERTADVLSMSWGEPEVGVFNAASTPCAAACNASTDGSFAILNPILELGAAEGIGAFAASGDCGSADGTSGVAVNYPASDPYVVGVGATVLNLTADGAYGGETAWSGNASGASGIGCVNQGGSGGGFSVLPRPWWQAGEGVRLSDGRGVPDVAIVGGAGSPVGIVAGGRVLIVAGTSVGTPIWAGIEAVADQATGVDLGWLLPSLYTILRSSAYPDDFHSITAGSNGYPAGAGWNPVTGIGSPIVGNLTADLVATPVPRSTLSAYVYASPRFGPAPLTVRFALTASGGTGTYPLEGVEFGDGTAASVPLSGTVEHTFARAGVYSVQGYVLDNEGNATASPPVVVVVGSGGPLTVALNVSPSAPTLGENVTFTATVAGGGPYLYNFTFGDGSTAINRTAATAVHAFGADGTYCAAVVVRTEGAQPAGGASARVAVRVGGAAASSCGNPAASLTLTPEANPEVRDAPAEFPSLFDAVGGATAPDGLGAQVGFASSDPYLSACGCAIFRSAGNYTVDVWENDTENDQATTEVNVTVALPLEARFTASTLAGPAPLTVDFAASVSGGYEASAGFTHWRFGDGAGAVGASAIALYDLPGEYLAIASVSDHGYGNASEAFLIDVESPAAPSAVGLTGTIEPAVNVSSGTAVTWTAAAVGPTDELVGTVVAFDLGDGGGAFGPTARETYDGLTDVLPDDVLSGSVTLDSVSLTPTLVVPVALPQFFAVEAGGFVPATDALVLTADVPAADGLVPLGTAASASATGPGGATIAWQFGDGATARGPNGSHVYYAAGRYTEKVTAADGFADTAVRLQTVVALPALAVACGPGLRFGNVPFTLRLAPTATGGVGPSYRFAWTLPNGTVSNATVVSLTFDAPGRYAVGLTVYDEADATVGCAWSIVVTDVPSVTFLEVIAGGVGIGIVLAAVFVWATRPPRPKGDGGGP